MVPAGSRPVLGLKARWGGIAWWLHGGKGVFHNRGDFLGTEYDSPIGGCQLVEAILDGRRHRSLRFHSRPMAEDAGADGLRADERRQCRQYLEARQAALLGFLPALAGAGLVTANVHVGLDGQHGTTQSPLPPGIAFDALAGRTVVYARGAVCCDDDLRFVHGSNDSEQFETAQDDAGDGGHTHH